MTRSALAFLILSTLGVNALVIGGFTIGRYPTNSNIFPAIAGILMLITTLVLVVQNWRSPVVKEKAQDDAPSQSEPMVWVGLLAIVVFTLGFRLGLPIFALAYSYRNGNTLPRSIGLALGVCLIVEVVFRQILNLPLDWGWLIETYLK